MSNSEDKKQLLETLNTLGEGMDDFTKDALAYQTMKQLYYGTPLYSTVCKILDDALSYNSLKELGKIK